MTTYLLLTGLMSVATLAWLTRPWWRHRVAQVTREHRALWLGTLAAAVFAVLGSAYALVGTAAGPGVESAAAHHSEPTSRAASEDASRRQAEARVIATIASLTEHLASHPEDAEGWQTLARSDAALGRHAAAIEAFKLAVQLHPNDPTWQAEYAFSLAARDPYAASGEPARLIEQALQLDPRNPKALALAGTLALDRRDYAAAVGHWEILAQIEPAESAIGKQLNVSLMEARRLAALQAERNKLSAPLVATSEAPLRDARIGGMLTLAPALAAQVSPQDTVFVYARSSKGSQMPLAVLRRHVKDLPLRFSLDDSLAMSPTATLSRAEGIVVGARISRAGTAETRDGDLQARPVAAVLGRQDLALQFNEVVHRP